MAEIKIEKKKPVWPWILLILIILAAIYFFWYNNERNIDNRDDFIEKDTVSHVEKSSQYQNETSESEFLYNGKYGTIRKEGAIADYLGYVDNLDNKSDDQNFYRMAFFKLITATKREAEIKNIDVSDNIASAMKNAEQLTNVTTENAKADNVKNAANDVSKALRTIQQKSFENLSEDAKAIETAVSGIDASKPLVQEGKNIDAFFDKSATMFQKMNETNTNY